MEKPSAGINLRAKAAALVFSSSIWKMQIVDILMVRTEVIAGGIYENAHLDWK